MEIVAIFFIVGQFALLAAAVLGIGAFFGLIAWDLVADARKRAALHVGEPVTVLAGSTIE